MRAWTLAALDLVFPASCASCAATLGAGRRDPLCGGCWAGVARIAPPLCSRCGLPLPATPRLLEEEPRCLACLAAPPAYDYARSAGLYAGPLRDALRAFKFREKRAMARPLAELVLEQVALAPDVAALVPVPLAKGRLRERGFNQAELLADRVGAALAIPVRRRWLGRVRETAPQSDLTAAQRRANVAGAFVASSAGAGQHVVIVDDVLTTGATVGECARALRDIGARRIGVATVARVIW